MERSTLTPVPAGCGRINFLLIVALILRFFFIYMHGSQDFQICMLYTWVLSFVGASVGALYAMCVGFKVFLHLSMPYAWVLRLFPDLHAIHVGFKL